MDTRHQILHITDQLVRERGYNAFSFSDIAKELNIRNASIHYHFPGKTSLGLALIEEHKSKLAQLIHHNRDKEPIEQLQAFFSIYSHAKRHNQVCLVGSLATDYYTVDEAIREQLKTLTDQILAWVTEILKHGKRKGAFRFATDARTKALLIITNMLASVQLIRLTRKQDFELITQAIIHDLTHKR